MAETFFDNADFQDALVWLLCNDQETLHQCAGLLKADDFKPQHGVAGGRARWIVAERALAFYTQHHQPVSKLLLADVLDYATNLGMATRSATELRDYCSQMQTAAPLAPAAIVEKVLRYKKERARAAALSELSDLQATGKLTDELWNEITARANGNLNHVGVKATDYFDTWAARERRRAAGSDFKPWTFIDPLDDMVRCIGRGQLGLIVAPYSRGKSMMLQWLAVACCIQHLNVLFLTLEDTKPEVEDRLDALVTKVPIKALSTNPRYAQARFDRFKRLREGGLHVYDGTDEEVTVTRIVQIVEEERNGGYYPDVLIADYDEKIKATRRRDRNDLEVGDTYDEFKLLLARGGMIGWLAAQTQRDTQHMKILSGDRVGDAISKMKKSTMAVTIGKGEWGDQSFYLWIARHKHDRKEVGCHIVPDLERLLIYDREATARAQQQYGSAALP